MKTQGNGKVIGFIQPYDYINIEEIDMLDNNVINIACTVRLSMRVICV